MPLDPDMIATLNFENRIRSVEASMARMEERSKFQEATLVRISSAQEEISKQQGRSTWLLVATLASVLASIAVYVITTTHGVPTPH
jgi:hypothetical protein